MQQPSYDKHDLAVVVSELADMSGLVSKQSIDSLLDDLTMVSKGDAVILQIGDCAETFADFSENGVSAYVEMFENSAAKIKEEISKDVVVIARIAGQFAKPRSADIETIDGISLPAYRGDIANDFAFAADARKCDPQRIMRVYEQSRKTVDIIERVAKNKIFVSHECLIIDYDDALVREFDGKLYCLSAHMLWVGYRTAHLGYAHIEFLSGIENPVGLKVGPDSKPTELISLVTKLNPSNKPSKIVLIARFGASEIDKYLSSMIKAVREADLNVIWISDPMHGNGYKASNQYKTRDVAKICTELDRFIDILHASSVVPGGLHLEATPYDVTECVLEPDVGEKDLHRAYRTVCDPRLNGKQVDVVLRAFCSCY